MLSRRTFLSAVAFLIAPWTPLVSLAADAPATGKTAAGEASVVRVACVGDSITYGAGVKEREKNSYPAVLGRLLGERYDVKNFGVSGATLLKKGDKPYDKEKTYQSALDFKPDVAIIKLGTNDSKPQNWDANKGDFQADYKSMIEAFRMANPGVKIVCALPVPVYPPGNFKIRDEIVKPEIIPAIRQVASETKCQVIDLYAALSDKPKLFPDKVHPNAEGASLIAAAVYQALTGKEAPKP